MGQASSRWDAQGGPPPRPAGKGLSGFPPPRVVGTEFPGGLPGPGASQVRKPAACPRLFVRCPHTRTLAVLALVALGLLPLPLGLRLTTGQESEAGRLPRLVQLFHPVSGVDGGYFQFRNGLMGTLATVQQDLPAAASRQWW